MADTTSRLGKQGDQNSKRNEHLASEFWLVVDPFARGSHSTAEFCPARSSRESARTDNLLMRLGWSVG